MNKSTWLWDVAVKSNVATTAFLFQPLQRHDSRSQGADIPFIHLGRNQCSDYSLWLTQCNLAMAALQLQNSRHDGCYGNHVMAPSSMEHKKDRAHQPSHNRCIISHPIFHVVNQMPKTIPNIHTIHVWHCNTVIMYKKHGNSSLAPTKTDHLRGYLYT